MTTDLPPDDGDTGLTANQLFVVSWLLAAASGGALLRLLGYSADDADVGADQLVWLAVSVVAAMFSACSMVLVGIKHMERRLAVRQLNDAEDS